MERRKLTKEDIDKVRNIDGFPIAKDEDIIALSDAPYYTACPNPFIAEFIKENGKPYDEASDDYHCEPFAADVSEGKSDPIYNAHTYHTKVPYKAIMRYILHYTNPGDIVYDGFCGTGMTGVAANMCGNPAVDCRRQFEIEMKGIKWGKRIGILNDLSPAATFISKNYNTTINIEKFEHEAYKILQECYSECEWMWQTRHNQGIQPLFSASKVGTINHIAWSDVLICPGCGNEIIFYKEAFTRSTGKVKDEFSCPHCRLKVKKNNCKKKQKVVFDEITGNPISIAVQVPFLINYTIGKKRFEKEPDSYDLDIIDKIENIKIKEWFPTDSLPKGYNTQQPIRSHGIYRVDLFYTKRILIFLAKLRAKIVQSNYKDALLLWFTSQLINLSKLNRYRPTVSFPYNPLSGTLYISSLVSESNPYVAYAGKIQKLLKAFSLINDPTVLVSTNSTTDIREIPSDSIDYIFTDPPFGGNLNYSELSFVWESWLKVKTQNKSEAIINDVQGKGLPEYQLLMEQCFTEYGRVLKPNRWLTVEFHNSKNAVWNSIQQALQKAGFVVADVRVLDKQLGTFKQTTSFSAVKKDLVISAYKPRKSFINSFLVKAGSVDTAWDFVTQHLKNLPTVVMNNGKIEILSERQSILLFDRMVAYHIMHNIPVPIDSLEFYQGLDERYLKRDEMYFLPDQINEYDTARIINDVEPIQISLVVNNEKTAISWLYQQLVTPQTYAEIQPKFMPDNTTVDKFEVIPELSVLLAENFLQDDNGKWYIPDVTKEADIVKLREKNLLKEFEGYLATKGKLKTFRSEAIRVGFAKLWKDKNYKLIVETAERLPEQIVQEDDKLLMYYDISLGRV